MLLLSAVCGRDLNCHAGEKTESCALPVKTERRGPRTPHPDWSLPAFTGSSWGDGQRGCQHSAKPATSPGLELWFCLLPIYSHLGPSPAPELGWDPSPSPETPFWPFPWFSLWLLAFPPCAAGASRSSPARLKGRSGAGPPTVSPALPCRCAADRSWARAMLSTGSGRFADEQTNPADSPCRSPVLHELLCVSCSRACGNRSEPAVTQMLLPWENPPWHHTPLCGWGCRHLAAFIKNIPISNAKHLQRKNSASDLAGSWGSTFTAVLTWGKSSIPTQCWALGWSGCNTVWLFWPAPGFSQFVTTFSDKIFCNCNFPCCLWDRRNSGLERLLNDLKGRGSWAFHALCPLEYFFFPGANLQCIMLGLTGPWCSQESKPSLASVHSAAEKPQVPLPGFRHCRQVFSAPLLHVALLAQSLARLVLGLAEGTAETEGTGAVRPTPWCAPCPGFPSMESGKAALPGSQRSQGMKEPRERLVCSLLLSRVERERYPGFRWWFWCYNTPLSTVWAGMALARVSQLFRGFHKSPAAGVPWFCNSHLVFKPAWRAAWSGGCLLPLGPQRLANQIPDTGIFILVFLFQAEGMQAAGTAGEEPDLPRKAVCYQKQETWSAPWAW